MGRVIKAIKKWNLFRDTPQDAGFGAGQSMSYRQARSTARFYNDGSIVNAIYVRMAVDFSGIQFFHAMLDESGNPTSIVRDALHRCLTLDPNIDQTAQHLKQDIAMTMFRHEHAVIAPIEADADPGKTESYNISQIRVGRVVAWFPRHVTIEVYDDRDRDDENEPINGGITKQVTVEKANVCIVENPFADIMNNQNGLLQRLLRKLAILDGIDEAAGSGKLDLIFQLPYTVRGDSRKAMAEERRQALAEQLQDDELGIGYIDVSEKVIQLNRPIDNKMLDQIEYLNTAVKTELGITDAIMNGSATSDQINQYYDRTQEPLANAVALEMTRKFISVNGQTRGHSIEIFRDPLKLIPIGELAEIVDKLRRAGVVMANEIRPKIGLMPIDDPAAKTLGNPNMPADKQGIPAQTTEEVADEGLPEGGGSE